MTLYKYAVVARLKGELEAMRNLMLVLVVLSGACATTEPSEPAAAENSITFLETPSGSPCGAREDVQQPEDFCAEFGGVQYQETTDGWFQIGCVQGPAMSLDVATGKGFAFVETEACQSAYEISR